MSLLFQTEDSEIDVDEDDEEDEEGEEEESKDLEDDSLEGPVSRGARPSRGGMRPPLMEESDNDFWMTHIRPSLVFRNMYLLCSVMLLLHCKTSI